MQNKIDLNVKGMHCASCVLKVEKAIKKLDNVKEANVNLATEKASINYEGTFDFNKARKEVQKVGYDIEMPMENEKHEMQGHDHAAMLKQEEIKDLKNKFILAAILSVFILIGTYKEFLEITFISRNSMFIIL